MYRLLCLDVEGPQFIWNGLNGNEISNVMYLLNEILDDGFDFSIFDCENNPIEAVVPELDSYGVVGWPITCDIDFMSDCNVFWREKFHELYPQLIDKGVYNVK